MKYNTCTKVLCSLPIILLFLYFIPFVGVCLILFRLFIYKNNKQYTLICLIVIGLLLLIPDLILRVVNLFKINIETIPHLEIIITTLNHEKLVGYGKFIIIVGIILLIIYTIISTIMKKVASTGRIFLFSSMMMQQNKMVEISKQNDMEMKIKREKAKNTHVVYCPNCGADNILSGNVGMCKYCRSKLEYKENPLA